MQIAIKFFFCKVSWNPEGSKGDASEMVLQGSCYAAENTFASRAPHRYSGPGAGSGTTIFAGVPSLMARNSRGLSWMKLIRVLVLPGDAQNWEGYRRKRWLGPKIEEKHNLFPVQSGFIVSSVPCRYFASYHGASRTGHAVFSDFHCGPFGGHHLQHVCNKRRSVCILFDAAVLYID